MQVSVETISGLERKLTVEIPAEQIDSEVGKRLQDLAKKVKLDGFRPGKVPMNVVKQRFGSGVRQEVINDVMRNTLYDAIQEKELNPAGMPHIQEVKAPEGEKLEYTATFEIFPEVTINELEGCDLEVIKAEVSDTDFDNMLDQLRKQHATWDEVDRASEDGDKLNIDFEGYRDDEKFEGGSAQGFELSLGSKTMIPGFEDGLVGKKSGEEVTLNLTFPENYGQKELAGKEAKFIVKVNKVLSSTLPELNDELTKKFNVEGGVDTFKKEVRANMDRELEMQVKSKNKEAVFNLMIEKNPVELPKALVDSEIQRMQQEMISRISGGKEMDMSKMPELPRDLFEEQAKRRVQLGLLVSEYVKQHEIKVDAGRVDELLERLSSAYEKPEEMVQWYRSNKDKMAELESSVLEDQVVEKLQDKAKIIEKTMDYDAVMNPKSAQSEE